MNDVLLDVNVLITSVVENHVDHQRAYNFVLNVEHFYTTPTTQGGFLRFLSRPWKDQQRREQPPRMSITEAFDTLRAVTSMSQHLFLPDDEPFTGVSLQAMSGHRQWTDAYLLRIAAKHRLRLASLDHKMENMDNPNLPVLLLIP